MARLADYFIVVGYDHEKPGKGVGRAPPPGFASAPGSRPVGSAGPGVEAGEAGRREGRVPRWKSCRSTGVGLRGAAEPGCSGRV